MTKKIVVAFLLSIVQIPAVAAPQHPKPHKIPKHKMLGDHRHHYFWQKDK